MTNEERSKRLAELAKVHPIARQDHRNFLNSEGKLPFFSDLTRKQKKEIDLQTKTIAKQYRIALKRLHYSGAGFPADKVLRELAIEYTHRYASSGVFTQPINFNYFEPFCHISLLKGSTAPYARIARESNHLFNGLDFFDYLTSKDSDDFKLNSLSTLLSENIYHFTTNGSVMDCRFMNADGREFIISGFSMIRRGNSLHWYMIGGEIYDKDEWTLVNSEQPEIDLNDIAPHKKAFLSNAIKEQNYQTGGPCPLEGTKTALRTVVCGEIDIDTERHLGRCYMAEYENSFQIYCDDPEVFFNIKDDDKRNEAFSSMMEKVEHASIMWNLAEGLFQLPQYFSHKIEIQKNLLFKAGKKLHRKGKGGQGLRGTYEVISAVEVTNEDTPVIREALLPHYQTETSGHWRRISPEAMGRDREKNPIKGKTWITQQSTWRDRKANDSKIFVKDSLAAARVKIQEYEAAVTLLEQTNNANEQDIEKGIPELYVMRCPAHDTELYKVGWTAGASSQRARELSSETSVPLAFVVVKSWKHQRARQLEADVHAMLAPYRTNDRREFFSARFDTISDIIEQTIARDKDTLN